MFLETTSPLHYHHRAIWSLRNVFLWAVPATSQLCSLQSIASWADPENARYVILSQWHFRDNHTSERLLKGIVHPKMRIHSLSTHRNAKHLWSFRGKQCCSRIQYNGDRFYKRKRKRTVSVASSKCPEAQTIASPEEDMSHHLLELYWILLQRCLPLKLQKWFVDSNTSPTPPSA